MIILINVTLASSNNILPDDGDFGTINLNDTKNTEVSVKIENLTSKPFLISSGVRQGDPLCDNI
jgi:hypothetical protein